MLDKCLEVCRVFWGLFVFVFVFSRYDLHVLPGIKQPLWGVGGEIFSFFFIFFYFYFSYGVGKREGIKVLQFWNSWWVHS